MTNNQATNESGLVITRTFDAPRELVFKVWTEAEHLKHWWGPAGLELEVLKLDVKPGGIFHFGMTAPDGNKMYGKFVYYEIAAPEKLVFTNSFADAEGNTIQPPFSDEFPTEIMNTLTLSEQDGKTTVTLQGGPHNANETQHAFFKAMHESMQQGFGGTFKQLEDYLAAQQA
ncbi:SRPBCC family protein [Paenibacillus albus]|uniref:SRPBCC domain-containing protein n=1 Tax=Paenibacillus albus TaxID=2495582 RepID=A0A3Q8X4D7_9BACL|nr:SRPBCC domain-containing protein [Paenibacillus albus]AZN38968.1 SRPBCC domain-containing protein [Paenibacillus albus]